MSTEAEITRAINIYYAMEISLEDMIKRVQASGLELLKGEEDLPEKLEKIAAEASVIQLVDLLVARAIMENASDIHIEPDEDTLRVRLRVDGLYTSPSTCPCTAPPGGNLKDKDTGDVNIAEKRIPQDGRFLSKIGGRDIDIRLSTLPTIFGEKAVLSSLTNRP